MVDRGLEVREHGSDLTSAMCTETSSAASRLWTAASWKDVQVVKTRLQDSYAKAKARLCIWCRQKANLTAAVAVRSTPEAFEHVTLM